MQQQESLGLMSPKVYADNHGGTGHFQLFLGGTHGIVFRWVSGRVDRDFHGLTCVVVRLDSLNVW